MKIYGSIFVLDFTFDLRFETMYINLLTLTHFVFTFSTIVNLCIDQFSLFGSFLAEDSLYNGMSIYCLVKIKVSIWKIGTI